MLKKIVFILFSMWVVGVGLFLLNIYEVMPDKYIVPSFTLLTLTITVCGLAVSYFQWAKNRIEVEFLKEQFRLVAKFLEGMQGCFNGGFTVIERDGEVLISGLKYFSALSSCSLREINPELFVVVDYPPEDGGLNLFIETKISCLKNPLFPSSIFQSLQPLQLDSFFLKSDYGRLWFLDDHVPVSEQFVLVVGSRRESRDKKPLRIVYKNDYLRVKDLIDIYERFNESLNKWLSDNHISDSLIPRLKHS